jgi:NitT/TauT family transport system ATP-binding protein
MSIGFLPSTRIDREEIADHKSSLSQPKPIAISLSGVDVTFKSGAGLVAAVKDVDLSIRKGEFVSIVGRSGCGKSTILRAIAGLLEPSNGKIAVIGTTADDARRNHSFGVVFQSSVMLPWLTAVENVKLPLNVVGARSESMNSRAEALLDMVGLKEAGNFYPRQLSGGMRQRVAIARALSFNPPILLMDEPFAAVDALTRQKLHTLLMNICARTEKTVLFITHDVYEAALLSDRVVVMTASPGRVKADIEVPFLRPRPPSLRSDPAYGALCARILDLLMEEED